MGLFDKIKSALNSIDKEVIETVMNKVEDTIVLAPASHEVEMDDFGNDDSEYRVTFRINDSFKEAKSHAGEVMMLNTYSPESEYGEEGKVPYIAIQNDDDVYCPVEEFKEKGTFDGAMELTPLGGKFYFKAKKEYYGDIMYFYGLDRLDGFWENNGICLVYPKSYVGTEDEKKLVKVLDEVAESYREEKIN